MALRDRRGGPQGGLIPTNDGHTCVWVGVPRDRFAMLRPVGEESLLRGLDALSPAVAAEVRAGRRVSHVRGYVGEPGVVRRPYGPGWALVGDAGHYKDPVTAHGMTDALRDAELLSRALVEVARGADEGETLAAYARRRDDLSRSIFSITDQVTGFRGDLERLDVLLRSLSAALKEETAALLRLDEPASWAA
ncbi:MAG: NAD(P)/FAD-dependent oxidoreductase [Actinomycetes bacterium]